jgi:hypothetical protein
MGRRQRQDPSSKLDNMMPALRKAILLVFILSACRERYGLPMEASTNNLLVVEGNILNGDTTVVRLSRTSALGERTLVKEEGATITVEGTDNSVYALHESAPGVYKSEFLSLDISNNYRLKIIAGGKEYESTWTGVISTPEIDSLSWRRENGVEIFVASHGTADDTRYYKWDYEEVWDFYSHFKSKLYFTYVQDSLGVRRSRCEERVHNGMPYTTCVEPYDPTGTQWNDTMYHCWKYNSSTAIHIGSTAALSDNVVWVPVRKHEEDSWELNSLYSILVKQTGLSKDAYEFYRILKGNSEGLGSIFDALPSQLKTNLRCVSDPAEPVLGFVDATTVRSKRIFINVRDLPGWRFPTEPCTIDSIGVNGEEAVKNYTNQNLIPADVLQFDRTPPHPVLVFSLARRPCIDCRVRGVHLRPPFWP